ncbi:MAG TPA: GFA family protein [Steroidobacteraceae bacterium]
MYTGSCLCGGIQFRIARELAPIEVGHCRQCRKAQGGPLATNSAIDAAGFNLVRGADLLTAYESSPGKKRVFCSRCGAPIYSVRDALPNVLRIRVGLVDEPIAARPVAHIQVASNCKWWPISDSLPQFPAEYAPQQPQPA